MNRWFPFRMSSLVAAVMAANLSACAGSSSSSQSGSEMAQAQSAGRAAPEPLTPVTPTDERALACLHCAP